jgi:hypothetical protein
LGFISDLIGYDTAKQQSNEIEYDWKEDPEWDPFSDPYLNIGGTANRISYNTSFLVYRSITLLCEMREKI